MMRPVPLAATVAVGVAIVDQLTKRWAVEWLAAGPCTPGGDECIDLVWTLRLHLHYNPGAAFSTGVGLGPAFGVFAFAMILVLFNLVRGRTDTLGPVLLGAIAGGAIGNLTDRVVRADDGFLSGSVVDFIDVQWWPIFNIADAAVVVGVIAFVLYSLVAPDAGKRDQLEPVDSDGGGSGGDSEAERVSEPSSVDAVTGPDRTPSGG